MSGDTRGWTIETLKEHICRLNDESDKRYEQKFAALERALELATTAQRSAIEAAFAAQKEAVNAALMAADRAVTKAELAAEKRFESVNEFRDTLADQQRTLIPRQEVTIIIDALTDKLNLLQRQMNDSLAERKGIQGGYGYAVGAIGLILAVLAILDRII